MFETSGNGGLFALASRPEWWRLRQRLACGLPVVCFATAFATRAHAQQPAPGTCATIASTPSPRDAIPWGTATVRPELRPGSVSVKYPEAHRQKHVSGVVNVEFVLRDIGRVDTATIRVLEASDELFAITTRRALTCWKFEPAQREGRAESIRGRLRVEYLSTASDTLPQDAVLEGPTIADDGISVRLGWVAVPYAPPAVVDTEDVIGVVAAVVRNNWPKGVDSVVCLKWNEVADAPPSVVRGLAARGLQVRSRSSCPPSAPLMIRAAPKGGTLEPLPTYGPDPVIIRISGLRPWTRDMFVLECFAGRGSRDRGGRCFARRNRVAGTWDFDCPMIHVRIA